MAKRVPVEQGYSYSARDAHCTFSFHMALGVLLPVTSGNKFALEGICSKTQPYLFYFMGSGFQGTGQFSNFPYFGAWNSWNSKKVQKMHMNPLITLEGSKLSYFLCRTLWDMSRFWKLPYLGMTSGFWNSSRNSMIHVYSFYPREDSLFLLYGQQFTRYEHNFKIFIFGLENWNLKKLQK